MGQKALVMESPHLWEEIEYGYGSIPVDTIFNGMDIHLPAILMFTRGTGFWPISIWSHIYKPPSGNLLHSYWSHGPLSSLIYRTSRWWFSSSQTVSSPKGTSINIPALSHHYPIIIPIKHSYVSLPEGKSEKHPMLVYQRIIPFFR